MAIALRTPDLSFVPTRRLLIALARMSGNSREIEWVVTLLGPTGVGKTSLVSTLYQAIERFYAGKPVQVIAADTATEEALIENNEMMTAELAQGRFEPSSELATTEPVTYRLRVELVKRPGELDLALTFLDFPGGWINDGNPEHKAAYQQALTDSCAVILPIDAVVLLETPTDLARWRNRYLQIERIKIFIEHWAKHRAAAKHKDPALLVLAPVKCESYFSDNGGDNDRSEELRSRTYEAYRDVIDAYRNEYGPGNEVLYAPVDTIGCIQLDKVEFPKIDGETRLTDRYRVRGVPRRSIYGAEPILAHIVKDVLEVGADWNQRKLSLTENVKSRIDHDIEGKEADRRKLESNWLIGFFNRVLGRTGRVDREIANLAQDRETLMDRLGDLQSQLQDLADAIDSHSGQWDRQRSL